jgi:4-cresol dehydrogenase (hydroxylating)
MAPSDPSDPDFPAALDGFAKVLGVANVLADDVRLRDYLANTAGLRREVRAALTPCSTSEVQAVVQLANRFKTPLYPISRGRNWGYGSSLPVRDGAIIVDLHRMDLIRNKIDMAGHFAVIEPGVTQAQLSQHLQASGLPLLFNATAAGSDTSVLGNSLDRGFGYFAMRPNDISALEVVLGNGEILRTGYGHWGNAEAAAQYGFGLGPSLDGLFFQSNLGIVTSAALHLHPRRECHKTLLIRLREDSDFTRFIDILAGLRRESLFESVLHIGSRNRIRVTLSPLVYQFLVREGQMPGPELRRTAEDIVATGKIAAWTGVGGLYGTNGEVEEKLKEITHRLQSIAAVEAVSADSFSHTAAGASLNDRALLESARALADFSSGIPSNGALLSPLWAIGVSPTQVTHLDHTPLGLLFCCPAIPLEGSAARVHIDTAASVFARFGFTPYMTLNIVNTKAMLLVLNLVFNREDSAESARAHTAVDTLFDEWAQRGIYPYRLGVQSMGQFVKEEDSYWQLLSELKRVFDPNCVIAPGRYSLV